MSGFAGGALGSLGAELWGGAMKGLGLDKFAESTMGTVAFGALSGGIGAELSGGNFWQGAVTGGIVAALNHVAHMEKASLEVEDNGYDKNGKKVNDNGGDTTDYMYDDKGNIISSTKVKVLETNHFGQDFEGYGLRVYNVKSGGLYDPSFDIFTSFVGGGVVKNTVGMGVWRF